jgi:hypothetical protein
MKISTFVFVVIAMIVLSGSVQARATELINIQFQALYYVPVPVPAYTGKAVIGTNNDVWNQLTTENGTRSSLLNSSGISTAATISWEGSGLFAGYNSSDANGFASGPQNVLMNSYLYSSQGSGIKSILIGGLKPKASYNLYIYTEGDHLSNGRNLHVSINGGETQITTSPDDHDVSTFILNQNYLHLSGVTNYGGDLSLTYQGVGENLTGYKEGEANINAIQLLLPSAASPISGPVPISGPAPNPGPVPEPASIILFGTGVVSLISSRLRRKKAA